MKNLFGALCLMVTSFVLAQDYVSGYYITANGQKITGEYEAGDFSSPEKLKFRTGAEEFMRPDLKAIQELGVANSYKYVKYTVEVDAANTISDNTIPEKPMFVKKEVFLNVLAEGDATLFSYYDNWDKDVKFFLKTLNMPVPQQLVHREYYINGKPAENNDYIKQISAGLVCEGLKGTDIVQLKYTKSALTRIVKQYNSCKGSNNIVYDNRAGKKINLLFSVYAGVHMFSFEMSGGGVPPMAKDTGTGFAIGGEMELLLPSKQLGLFLRVDGETFNTEVEGTFAADDVPGSHKYYVYKTGSVIGNASVGPRYYYTINESNRLFIDFAATFSVGLGGLDVYDYVVSSTTVYPREFVDKYNFGNALSLNAGIGYSFNNRFAVELRANTNRDLIDSYPENSKMKYSRAGIGIKYTF